MQSVLCVMRKYHQVTFSVTCLSVHVDQDYNITVILSVIIMLTLLHDHVLSEDVLRISSGECSICLEDMSPGESICTRQVSLQV